MTRRDRLRRWAARLAVGYLLVVLAAAAFLWLTADVTVPGTLLMFAPRWVFALPLLVLLPLAAVARSRVGLGAAVVAALIVAGPLTGGTASWSAADDGPRFRVVTLNADGKALDRTAFAEYLRAADPDVVFLQEWAGEPPAGWKTAGGQTGMRVLAKDAVRLDAERTGPEFGPGRGVARFTVDTPYGEIEMVNVHLPTPRHALEAVLHRAPNWADGMRQAIAQRDRASAAARDWLGPPTDRRIVAGDFNLPPESRLLARDWSDYTDAFRAAGTGWGWTFHTRLEGVRIDRVLVAAPWRVRAITVGPTVGSAHRPVQADLDFGSGN